MVRIPVEYQEVEYIQGTSNARIDTGIPGNNDDLVISGKVYLNKFSAYQGFFGNYIDEDHNTSRLILDASANGAVIADINRRAANSSAPGVGFYAGNVGEFKVSKTKLIFNGTEYSYGGVNNATANDTNILLNVSNPATTTSNSVLYRRWYYFRINDGDTALRNYIPCYRKSDSKPGMYDTVTNQFFAGYGTEEFIVGNDVSWDTASLIERRRQILLNTPHLETISDSMASFKTDVPALVKDCKVYFSPIQDLHGYDSPWPAGGGKNLWGGLTMANDIASATGVTVDTNNKTVSITTGGTEAVLTSGIEFKENTQYTFILDASTYSGHANLMFVYTDGTNDRGLGRYMDTGANVSAPGKTVQSIVKRSYSNTTIINYETSGLFEGVKTANDYIPYENICPITGWDEVTVTRCGKNLTHFDQDEMVSTGWNRAFPNPFKKAGRYTMSCQNEIVNGSTKGALFVLSNNSAANPFKALTTWAFGDSTSGQMERVVDISEEDTKYNYIVIRFNTSPSYQSIINAQIQIEESPTATAYEPYTGTSITIPFQQTFYGGYVDLVKGEVLERWVCVDMDAFKWTYVASTKRFETQYLDRASRTAGLVTVLSDVYNGVENVAGGSFNSYAPDKSMCFNTVSGRPYVILKDSNYTDAESFKASLSGHKLVYKLATPNTYQLTPETIKTLRGVNNIWSNANGNIEVKFWKH